MRKVRSRTLPIVTALGVLGFLGGAWLVGPGHTPHAAASGAPGMAPVSPERVVAFERPGGAATVSPPAIATEPTRAAAEPVVELSPAAAAQFVTLCQLRLLAAETDLELSHREWATLAAVFAHTQAVRLAYEAEIANAAEIAPGRYRVEIPAYAAAGDELRRRFLADLREGLGAPVAAEVMEAIGRQLEARFAGFGVSAQTLDISGDPANAPGDVTIQRTARYWNSLDGGERVTTRREVHFPSAEDPVGEQWTPLLALVGKSE